MSNDADLNNGNDTDLSDGDTSDNDLQPQADVITYHLLENGFNILEYPELREVIQSNVFSSCKITIHVERTL